MKILFVINALTIGGAQFLLLKLAREAVKRGHSVEVACFKTGPVAQQLKAEGIRVHLLKEIFFDLVGFIKLVKLLRRFKPDIIHSHLFRASFWARLARLFSLKSVLVTSIHGVETDSYAKLERAMYKLSDKIIFASNYLETWYNKTVCRLKDSGVCVYPGIAVRVNPDFCNKPNLKSSFNICTLSRLHKVKGVDTLIKACSLLKMTGVDFMLNIAGEGPNNSELKALAKELGIADNCRFLGILPNKEEFLSRQDVFVAASREEAFGIHICEAMECGVPVLASKVGGIPEIVLNNETGRLFPAGDFNELAELLIDAHENMKTAQTLAVNARKRIIERFSEDVFLKKHFDLFNFLVAKKRKSIHFVVSSGEMGGGERLALGLIKKLSERGFSVTATCAGEPLAGELRALGIATTSASMFLYGTTFAFAVAKDLLRHMPSFVSSHLNRAGLISGLLSKIFGFSCVSHVHGLNRLSYYEHSDKLIAVSKAVKKHLVQQGADEKTIAVILNSIDKLPLGVRRFPLNGVSVAITAKLHANKGHEWALKAIANSLNSLPIKAIHIIGDGSERENLQKLCASRGLSKLVKFHGFVSNPDELYPSVDIALLPSASEGIPLSLLEAMRFGIPCVATNVGGIPEVVTDGKNGYLIPFKDEKALADALKRLCNVQTYESFSKASIDAFNALNNYEIMVDYFEKMLN